MKKLFLAVSLFVLFVRISNVEAQQVRESHYDTYLLQAYVTIDKRANDSVRLDQIHAKSNEVLARFPGNNVIDIFFGSLITYIEQKQSLHDQDERDGDSEDGETVNEQETQKDIDAFEDQSTSHRFQRSAIDLRIQDMYVDTTERMQGQYPIGVIICNDGTDSLSTTRVVVKYERLEESSQKVVKSVSEVISLRAGQCLEKDDGLFRVSTKDLTFSSLLSVFDPETGYISPLNYSIRAHVDNVNAVFESDETNNFYDEVVRVYPIKE